MTNKFELRIVQTDELHVGEEMKQGEIYFYLVGETRELEPTEPYVDLLNRVLYENNSIKRWVVDAKRIEQHKAENSIEHGATSVILFLQANKDWLIPLVSTIISPLIELAVSRIFEPCNEKITVPKASAIVKEYLEGRREGLDLKIKDYDIRGIADPTEASKGVLKSPRPYYKILIENKRDKRFSVFVVSCKGNITGFMDADEATLKFFNVINESK